ncbi:MAG TPA: hypothetical protein VHZ49_20375 [Methylomirabilota bacterium]|nr:hypothetical protein [Methylomirabilota bacterium]
MPLSRLDRRGIMILCGIGAFVVVLLGSVAGVMWNRPIIGPDNCVYRDKRLLRRAATDQTVVLVDQSEALTDTHRRFALSFLKDYVADDARFAVRSRIALFTFSKLNFESPAPASFRPVSDLCRPPSHGNELYENNRKITKDFYTRFLVPVTTALEESLTTEVGERSPILETLQMISRSQEIDDGGRKTLIVVSDMLQNTAGFSHYRERRSYEDFVRSGFASDVKADWRDWSIVVLYLRRYRDRRLQQGAHVDFWQRYFHDAGGKITRWAGVD